MHMTYRASSSWNAVFRACAAARIGSFREDDTRGPISCTWGAAIAPVRRLLLRRPMIVAQRLAVFSVGLSLLIGCGEASSSSDSADGSNAEIDASAETREAIGVDQWRTVESGVTGYDISNQEVVSLRFGTTPVSADSVKTSVVLKESDRLSHYEFTVEDQHDGTMKVGDLRRDEPNPSASLRTWAFLHADIAGRAAAPSSVQTSALRPAGTPLLKTGGQCTVGTHSGWDYVENVAQVMIQHSDGSWTVLECQ